MDSATLIQLIDEHYGQRASSTTSSVEPHHEVVLRWLNAGA
jgi:hypothetical protein